MATHHHSRISASSTSSNASSSYQLILDHILTYPGSYEIPLRTMYTLNCQPRAQSQPGTPTSSTSTSPSLAQGSFNSGTQSTESFTQNLMAQMSNLPNAPSTLPPSFITSFVQRCFPTELTHVDFPSALTGLDYLKDLETRRRREVAAAMERLEIDRETLEQDSNALSDRYPGVLQWVKSIEEKERKIDTLYTSVYIGLRRWILINEMSLLPFNKHNCIGMLNTLYPPVGMPNQPTSKLTPSVLQSQRQGFFKYILQVEKGGPRVLHNLQQQGKGLTEVNGWPAVTRTVGMYLQVANSIVNECTAITNKLDISPQKKRDSGQSKHSRKADSGISFGSISDRRPSTRGSQGEPESPIEMSRPKTPSGGRSGTALEKLARGLKGIGRSRTDVTEMIRDETTASPPPVDRPKILRKMRSLGSLGDRKGNSTSLTSLSIRQESDAPAYDVEEMRRQRMKYEAGVAAQQTPEKRASNEV